MLTLSDLDFFAVVARSRSLAAVARAMDVTPSAVTQRLQDLERRLDLRLVVRSGHQISLTDEGELLISRGQDITDSVAALVDAFAARRGEVVGHLRVLAPLGFGRQYIAPIVAAFAAEHQAITVSLVLSDKPGRVSEALWDVAVHVGDRRDGPLTARTIAPNGRVLCASPQYVARHGAPDTPHALPAHRCIALRENDEDVTLWRFTDAQNAVHQVRVSPTMSSNDGDVVRAWALDGHGIIMRSEWSVADDLRTGALVPLLDPFQLPDADVVAFVGPRGGRLARATRFMHALRIALTPTPWRDKAAVTDASQTPCASAYAMGDQ